MRNIIINTLLHSQEILALVNTHYLFNEIQNCRLIRRGFNDHYLIESGNQKYIFRVYLNHKYYIDSPDAFQFELELLEHLHSEGIPVANALRMKNGELLGCTSSDYGNRAFTLFPYAPGSELNRNSITVEQSFQLGKTMAELHLSANRFKSALKRYHLDLKYLVDEPLKLISAQISKGSSSFINTPELAELEKMVKSLQPIEELVKTVKSLSINQDEFGIIHADLHHGNVHFQDNELVIFDFDHCAYGWRAYDLAISFSLSAKQQQSMLRGYESRRCLSNEERESLPVFAKLRQLWDIGDMLATDLVRANPTKSI